MRRADANNLFQLPDVMDKEGRQLDGQETEFKLVRVGNLWPLHGPFDSITDNEKESHTQADHCKVTLRIIGQSQTL